VHRQLISEDWLGQKKSLSDGWIRSKYFRFLRSGMALAIEIHKVVWLPQTACTVCTPPPKIRIIKANLTLHFETNQDLFVSVACHLIIVDGLQKAYVNIIIIIIISDISNSSYFRTITIILSSIIKPVLRVFNTGCCGERLDSVGRRTKKIA